MTCLRVKLLTFGSSTKTKKDTPDGGGKKEKQLAITNGAGNSLMYKKVNLLENSLFLNNLHLGKYDAVWK